MGFSKCGAPSRYAVSVMMAGVALSLPRGGEAAFGFSASSKRRAHPNNHLCSPFPSDTHTGGAFCGETFAPQSSRLFSTATSATSDVGAGTSTKKGFIETELRGAAMRLHTKSQAPKEGQAKEVKRDTYVPTLDDYLAFLVDSKHVYEAVEDAVNSDSLPELEVFRNTGLERTEPLERDIQFLVNEYDLVRPPVGKMGQKYASEIREIASKGRQHVPEFVCHYYNHYFAHTAGGRMIGKKMAALLLDKRTLDFYKWDGDLNEIKDRVKANIEVMASSWTKEEKEQCVAATAAAFRGGGGLNSYLNGAAQ